MKRGYKEKIVIYIFLTLLCFSGCTGRNYLPNQKTVLKPYSKSIFSSEIQDQKMNPELLQEFDEKSQKWPHIRHLYKEGYFDSIIMDSNLVILLFKDPYGIGDTYFVWGRSGKQILEGVSGLFWVSYSDEKPYTDIKDAHDIYVSQRALTLVPLPVSPVISSVSVEGNPIEPMKTHGDLWFTTWADDDNLYCSWGDGTGIGKGPFTDMGIGCLTGALPDITGEIKYRDSFTEKDDLSQNNKPSSLLFIDGRLYVQVHSPLGDPTVGYLAYSDDYGITWKRAEGDSPWNNTVDSNFRCLFFVNMGKNYELNTDGYVYALGIGTEWGWQKGLYMARVPKDDILDYTAYEYLVAVEEGIPSWSSSQFDANPLQSVYTRGQASAMYHSGINRYVLLTAQDVFDAPNPWGPWTYAGSWARPPPRGWVGGYQPGIISKDTGENYFWFTIAGQPKNPWSGKEVKYSLNLGKMVMKLEGESDSEVDRYEPNTGFKILITFCVIVVFSFIFYVLIRKR